MPGGTAQYPRMRMPQRVIRGRFLPVAKWATGAPSYRSPKFYGSFSISGTTRDSAGTALGSCEVHLFETGTDIEIAQTNSDGAGAFTFVIGNNAGYFYIVAYKAGSPDVAGTSVNTLTAA